MATEVKMPQLGLQMDYGTITAWHKEEGDSVKTGDELFTIETEKITSAIESPTDGVLLAKMGQIGDELAVGAVVALIGEPGEAGETGQKPAAPAAETPAAQEAKPVQATPVAAPAAQAAVSGQKGKKPITPLAKKLASQMGVDYVSLPGSGPGGRIVAADIRKAAEQPAPAAPALPGAAAGEEGDYIPYTGMRKKIGDNMAKSWNLVPKVTHFVKADVTDLLALRKELNANREKEQKLSVTDFLVYAVARALVKVPAINVSLTEKGILQHGSVHIGVAVSIPNGLIVPVVKHACRKGLAEIGGSTKDLITKAREGNLGLDEITGATFTISNLGNMQSVEFFTPIINQPESAILGVGLSEETPVVRDGQIVIRTLMGLSFSYDHRVIDGALAARFIEVLLEYLKNPVTLIL